LHSWFPRCRVHAEEKRDGGYRLTVSYGEPVPRISFFYGISIYMYWNEAHHAQPHFHARCAGQAASIDLDGNIIAGSLPRHAKRLVAEWARLHRAELEANWQRARREQELEPVEPLP
jgi:uncharacterized protein DUF4160